jgi:hypothetical protein
MPGNFVSSERAAQLRASVGGGIDQSVALDGGRKSNPGKGCQPTAIGPEHGHCR